MYSVSRNEENKYGFVVYSMNLLTAIQSSKGFDSESDQSPLERTKISGGYIDHDHFQVTKPKRE